MGDKTDITGHSFVADQMNWEGRVHSENAAPKEWEESWGPIYDSRADSTKNPLDVGKQLKEEYYSHRIQKLEQDLKKMDKKGAPKLQTQNMSYGSAPAFSTVGVKSHGKRSDPLLGGPTSNLTV
jgi:hypothetical protein